MVSIYLYFTNNINWCIITYVTIYNVVTSRRTTMEEKESRFERILNKLTMFLNQDNITSSKPNNAMTQMIMFKKEASRLKRYIYEHDLAVEVVKEKEINSQRVKLTLKKL